MTLSDFAIEDARVSVALNVVRPRRRATDEASCPVASDATKLACASKAASLVSPALAATLLLVALAIAVETRLALRLAADLALDRLALRER